MKTGRHAPIAITVLVASFLAPTEFSLYIAGLRLPPHRLALLALVVPACWRLISRRDTRIRTFDIVFLLYNLWTVGIFVQHGGQPDGNGGQSDGLVFGGSLALESFGAYIVARAYVRDPETLLATLRLLLGAVVVAALIALPETLSGKLIVHDTLRSLTGYDHPTTIEQRLGFTRAYATFDHPIHYGTFISSLLAMAWLAQPTAAGRIGTAALLVVATFLGLSSAPLLCLGLQAGMLGWERITRGLAARTAITAAILVGLYIGVSLVSTRSPIAIIATGFTIDSWTGYYRLQIWEHGLANVWAHPVIGLGLADWERPWWMVAATVDAFWLVITMRAGIPAFLLLALAIVLLARAVVRYRMQRRGDARARRVALGWLMSLVALCLVACTVHYWNVLHTYFFFMLGLASPFADPVRAKARAGSPATPARASRPRRLEPADDEWRHPPPLPPYPAGARALRTRHAG